MDRFSGDMWVLLPCVLVIHQELWERPMRWKRNFLSYSSIRCYVALRLRCLLLAPDTPAYFKYHGLVEVLIACAEWYNSLLSVLFRHLVFTSFRVNSYPLLGSGFVHHSLSLFPQLANRAFSFLIFITMPWVDWYARSFSLRTASSTFSFSLTCFICRITSLIPCFHFLWQNVGHWHFAGPQALSVSMICSSIPA